MWYLHHTKQTSKFSLKPPRIPKNSSLPIALRKFPIPIHLPPPTSGAAAKGGLGVPQRVLCRLERTVGDICMSQTDTYVSDWSIQMLPTVRYTLCRPLCNTGRPFLRSLRRPTFLWSLRHPYFLSIYPFAFNVSAHSTAPPAAPRTVLCESPTNFQS